MMTMMRERRIQSPCEDCPFDGKASVPWTPRNQLVSWGIHATWGVAGLFIGMGVGTLMVVL